MSDPCRDAFEKSECELFQEQYPDTSKFNGQYNDKRVSEDWKVWQAAWNARPVAEVPSEPTVDQYMEAWDDDCTDEAFGELAWSENNEATSVDHAHADGFHRGWLTLRTLLIQRQGKCDT